MQIFPVEDPTDSASLHQLILANITPELEISYEPFNYNGNNIMVLTIKETVERPYMVVKELKVENKIILRKGEIWIRKGSHNKLATREDLEKIYARRFLSKELDGKVDLTFENDTHELEIACVRDIELPSVRERKQIEDQIHWKEELLRTDPPKYSERFGNHRGLQTAYSEMDLPALRSRLSAVEMNYYSEDQYYLHETRACKLNFVIHNSGAKHLENAMIKLIFPATIGFTVAHHIYLTTPQQVIVTGIDYQEGYPRVERDKESIVVTEEIGEIRHLLPTRVFKQPLRLLPLEILNGHSIILKVTIFASNLQTPQNLELKINFK